MKFNDRGAVVETVQGKLLRLGYRLPRYGADGHCGDETWDALQQYARDRRLGWAPEVPQAALDDLRRGPTMPDIPITVATTEPDLDDVSFIHLEEHALDPHPKGLVRHGQTVRRNHAVIDGITLHQMAVELRPSAYYQQLASKPPFDAHDDVLDEYAIALRALYGPRNSKKGGVAAPLVAHDDLVICTMPLDWYIYHGNRLNRPTLGIEVSGRFSGLLDDPNTPPREDLRTTWGDEPPMVLTPARIRGGRAAVRYAVEEGRKQGMPIRFVYAHRQSNGGKPGDPGEALWQALVIDYAVPVLGLVPRYDFTLDDGRPIPKQWDPNGVGSYR
ncbi:MAG: hypothetical protein GY769_20275 [bacterium]|nr:hypothetical protein [bacterium]